MATPMTRTKLLQQLRKFGVRYKEHGQWWTHNRDDETGKDFGPVHGLVLHHTGTDADTASQVRLLREGRPDLPGPLVQAGIDTDGVVHLVGWGRCNHAGLGDDDVFRHVRDEDYSGILKPNENNTDGNDALYGLEAMYSGSHGMTPAQYKGTTLFSAAICDGHGWSSKSVIAHGEWTNQKWDPGYAPSRMMDMTAVRSDIQDAIDMRDIPERQLSFETVKGYMPKLRKGDRNWYVKWMQTCLNRFGWDLNTDGFYGDSTAHAVKVWYKNQLDLTRDGNSFGQAGWRRVLSLRTDREGAE